MIKYKLHRRGRCPRVDVAIVPYYYCAATVATSKRILWLINLTNLCCSVVSIWTDDNIISVILIVYLWWIFLRFTSLPLSADINTKKIAWCTQWLGELENFQRLQIIVHPPLMPCSTNNSTEANVVVIFNICNYLSEFYY